MQITKDNIIVLYHPRELANKIIREFMFAELQKINPQIPSFAEVLNRFPDIEIIVDLKSLPVVPLIDSIIKLVDKKSAWDRLVFYSKNTKKMKTMKHFSKSFWFRNFII